MYYGIRFETRGQGIFYDEQIFSQLHKAAKKIAKPSVEHAPPTFLDYYIASAPSPFDQYKGYDYQHFDHFKFAFTTQNAAYTLFGMDDDSYFEQLDQLLKRGLIEVNLYEIPSAVYDKDYQELIFLKRQVGVQKIRTATSLEAFFEWDIPKSFCLSPG